MEEAGWRVTVEDKSSVNELAGFFVSRTASSMQEGGTTSSANVAKQFPDAAEVGKMPKESVSVEQGHLLRAAEPDQCELGVKAKPIPEMLTQRQREVLELTRLLSVSWYSAWVYGKDADDRHRQRQDSKLEDASSAHVDVADDDGMANSRLRFKVLMNQEDRSVAAMAGPKDVTEHTVRVVCDKLETWRFGVCSLKCQNETAEITSQNDIFKTRRVETILRSTSRYSHNSLGHWESDVKQAEKQIRATILHTLTADHKFDSDRPAA